MKNSKIQYCDDTVNPGMGCDGCELWPTLEKIISILVNLILRISDLKKPETREKVAPLVKNYEEPTELLHEMDALIANLREEFPEVSEADFRKALDETFKCYAGLLHQIRGATSIDSTEPRAKGHAKIFERPERFPGRMKRAASASDLTGTTRRDKPWLDNLPRLIFISDMGDVLSSEFDFEFLKTEIIDNVSSPKGSRHIWLWLTKRPARMAKFATWLETTHGLPWPDNLVAMTSVTSGATKSRIDQLRKVPAKLRGLSVEPLIEAVELDLTGIDWVITGGESGRYSREYDYEWARSLCSQSLEAGAAFFVKQLGANPVDDGFPVSLRDSHGGDWDEWPDDLRIRDLPTGFRNIAPKNS